MLLSFPFCLFSIALSRQFHERDNKSFGLQIAGTERKSRRRSIRQRSRENKKKGQSNVCRGSPVQRFSWALLPLVHITAVVLGARLSEMIVFDEILMPKTRSKRKEKSATWRAELIKLTEWNQSRGLGMPAALKGGRWFGWCEQTENEQRQWIYRDCHR